MSTIQLNIFLICNRLRYDVVHKFGGCMNIRNKIYISVGLVLPVTLIYYLTYVSVDKLFSKWCKTNYCFEFPPYADTLAIYVAVVGLYFVVHSLDAWKHQDQYQISKQNIKLLHTISERLNSFNVKISNVRDFNKEVLFLNTQRNKEIIKTQLFSRYESLMENLGIIQLVNDTYYKITQMEKGIYQNEFNTIINLAHSYVKNIDSEITDKNAEIMKKYQENIVQNEIDIKQQLAEAEKIKDEDRKRTAKAMISLNRFTNSVEILDLTQNQIDSIVTNNSIHHQNFSIKLSNLQDKLNKYAD